MTAHTRRAGRLPVGSVRHARAYRRFTPEYAPHPHAPLQRRRARHARTMKMAPGVRKFAITVHLACSVGWIGAVVAYLALGVDAVSSPNAQSVRAAWTAMEIVGW